MKNDRYELFENIMNSLSLDILEHGHLVGDRKWVFRNISSPFNRLYFVTGGEGYVENSFHRVLLRPGNVYLIPIYSRYDYVCNTYIEKFYIHFRLELFAGRDLFEPLAHCVELPCDLFWIDKLRKNAKSKNIRDIASCKSDIYSTVCSFLPMMPKGYENYTEISLKYGRIFNFIKNNLSAKLKISFVSQYANMEFSTLSKNFKNDLGISLKSYIDHMLMRKAKEKLLLTGLTIRMIAYELEFSDEFYFSRFFKKHAGIAPTTYRKTNRVECLF